MGNVAPCLAGGPVVKVMLPDATIEKYDRAVQVAELASQYPNYAVVHCSSAKPCAGQLRAVIIMKMNEFLVPGQAYILHPIPKSYRDSLRYSNEDGPGKLEESSDPDVGGERNAKIGGSGRRGEEAVVTAEELERSLSRTLMGPAIRKVPSEAALSQYLEIEEKDGVEKKEKADPASEPCGWTPDLYQIAED